MNRPFFSVVMPAYQAEKYLGTAIESIQRQSFEDWELLIIDDCSSDKTFEIASDYEKKDSRIRVIHREKNAGVSEARNLGITMAQGKYLWFVDADDTVEKTILSRVYDSLQENPAELVVFGLVEEYYSQDGKLEYKNTRKPPRMLLNTERDVRKQIILLEQQTLYGYPWNKVYDLIYMKNLGIRFEDYRKAKFIEDILFNIQFCMDIDSMNLLSAAPYHYAKRANESLTNEFVPEYYRLHRRRIETLWKQQKYWKIDMQRSRKILGGLFCRYILSALERNYDKRADISFLERRRFCRQIFADPLFLELVPYGKAEDSRMLKIALKLMQTKNVTLNLLFAFCIHLVRSKLPVIYSKVKSGR